MDLLKRPATPGTVGCLDVLAQIGQEIRSGRPLWMFTGDSTAQSLFAFIQGFQAALALNEIEDAGYRRFLVWARDEKGAIPPEGWVKKFLEGASGDHAVAIGRFLDLVTEFLPMR